MAYNFGYNTNPYYSGYNPQIQQPQPQQTAPQPQVQSGFICRPVTSREEALATPCDFMAAGVIMPDMAHGMIYLKRFNSQTGASDFADFAYTPPTAPAKDTADYTPRADFDKLCAAFAALQAGEKYCIVVAQAIPTATTINAPVYVTIGDGTTLYPLTNRCCAQLTACSIRTRTRYSAVVITTPTGGSFRLLGRPACAPNNDLRSINGTAPTTTTTGGETV